MSAADSEPDDHVTSAHWMGKRASVVDLGVVTAAWAYLSIRILWSGAGLDDITYSVPAQHVTIAAWADGHLALWSSSSFGGTPHLGNLQTAAMYPLHILASPFPDLLGADVVLIAHGLILGLGLYLLGRVLSLRRPAPAFMAVAGMWSGATVFKATLLVHFPPLAWAPIAMVCVHWLVKTDRPRRATACLAAIIWCVLMSGHPHSSLMALTLVGGWAIALTVETGRWRRLAHLGSAALLALAAAAPALFALRNSLATAATNERDEALLRTAGYVMPVRLLPRLLLGEPNDDLSRLYSQGERITYVGAAVIALAVVGLIAAITSKRWSLLLLAFVGASAASFSLGPRSPTLRLAREFLPGFDQPRVSTRWNWVLAMVLLVLAGAGIDRLRRGRSTREGWAVIAVVIAFSLSTTIGVEHGGRADNVLWLAVGATVVGIAFTADRGRRFLLAIALASLAMVELTLPMARVVSANDLDVVSTTQLDGPPQDFLTGQQGLTLAITNDIFEPEYLVEGMRPNAHALRDIRSIDGYDGGVAISRRWRAGLLQIIPTISDMPFRGQVPAGVTPEAMSRLGVRYVEYDPARGPAETTLPGWRLVLDDRFDVYENPAWHGDVTVWYESQLVAGPEDAGNQIRVEGQTLTHTALVEDESAFISCSGDCAPDWYTSSSATDGRRMAIVDATATAVVAFHEQYDPGWKVFVDGEESEAVAVDGIWTGVVVTTGTHRIELEYSPSWVAPSLLLMLLGWLTIVILIWSDRRQCPGILPDLGGEDSGAPTTEGH